MVANSPGGGVAEVLNVIKGHSDKHQSPKQVSTRRERLSGQAALMGGVIFFLGELLRQIGGPEVSALHVAALLILGLSIFAGGVIVNVVDFFRKTRRPLIEHVDGVIAAVGPEDELITALIRFETVILELTRDRLKLESTKVASRLGIIGGGEGLRTSLVGVLMLGAALIAQAQPGTDGGILKSLALFGLAFVMGLSIGGLFARYGASQSDYYCEIIRLALHWKTHLARTPREPFARRVGVRRSRITGTSRLSSPESA